MVEVQSFFLYFFTSLLLLLTSPNLTFSLYHYFLSHLSPLSFFLPLPFIISLSLPLYYLPPIFFRSPLSILLRPSHLFSHPLSLSEKCVLVEKIKLRKGNIFGASFHPRGSILLARPSCKISIWSQS